MAELDEAYSSLQFSSINLDRKTYNELSKSNIFNKIRELEILFTGGDSSRDLTIHKTNKLLEDDKFINYMNENFNFDISNLVGLDKNLNEFIVDLKSKDSELSQSLKNYSEKIDNLRNILYTSSEVLSNTNKEKKLESDDNNNEDDIEDKFYQEYKSRIMRSIDNYRTKSDKIKQELNYNYNLFNIIQKVNESEYTRSKYICSICHTNDKDVFLDCGHTFCNNCILKLESLKCPYCNSQSNKINKLLLE